MTVYYRILLVFYVLTPFYLQGFSTSDSERSSSIVYENKVYGIQDILSKYLQISSVSGEELVAGEFLKQLCIENGLHITPMGDQNGNYNFAASIVPLDKGLPNIIFLNHIDVVPPGDEEKWDYPPFSGQIVNDEIWGRGAFDNKGTAVMQLFSVIEIANRYRGRALSHNITFLPVSCEETQCSGGIKYVVDNYLEQLNPAVVIGEGPPAIKGIIQNKPDLALFGISVAQKRTLWLRLKLELKTNGHGSVTPLQYANKEMIMALNNLLEKKPKIQYNEINVNLLKRMGELNKGFTGFVLKHPKLFKPLIAPKLRKEPVLMALYSNTITLTSLNDGNYDYNVIPNKVTAILDCRLLPNESTDRFMNYVKQGLNNDDIAIEIVKETLQVEPSKEDSEFFVNLKTAIEQNYEDCKTATVILPNSNDTSYFRAHGIPAFSTVPVKIERKYLESIHAPNERIPLSILQKGTDTLTHFVELCLN